MRNWTRLLIIGGTIALVLAAIFFRRSTEITALITAVYVVLVFFQLQVMQDQHRAAQAERNEVAKREEVQRPKLEFASHLVRRTTEVDNTRGVELGPAWYVNGIVQNTGGSMARTVQLVLTAAAQRQPDSRWRPHDDWIPLGLRWSLDEINAVRGTPTEDRYLVPNRPYMFDLGKISLYSREPKFHLLIFIKSNWTTTRLRPAGA